MVLSILAAALMLGMSVTASSSESPLSLLLVSHRHSPCPRSGNFADDIFRRSSGIRVTDPRSASATASSRSSSSSPLTACRAAASRRRHGPRRLDTGILGVERSLIVDRGVSFVLGSDESGTGCIAGPVVAATCCILPLGMPSWGGGGPPPASSSAAAAVKRPLGQYDPIRLVVSDGTRIRDSKQLTSDERDAIYQEIVDNPHIYDLTVAQRSNQQIDATNNILTSAMECFQESIQELADDFLLCTGSNSINEDDDDDNGGGSSCSCYSIVDGRKAPKIRLAGGGGGLMPCRPFVKADSQVLTVALASVIAKVTRDRMAPEWHERYPQYGFDVHKGYATREHIEAIHRHGPCPLHRMTFKSLKGR